ncbi:MAG: hypothetical protein AAGH15_21365 [Myxococcota bacterium]
MRSSDRLCFLLLPLALAFGCDGFGSEGASAQLESSAAAPIPAGATCIASGDCTEGQLCVDGRCTYRRTSVAAEVLASAGHAQREAGDADGALSSYEQAIEAYRRSQAPVPPEVLCGAALAALRTPGEAELRERAARRADACFRGSLPGAPLRAEVLRALGRMRYDGLSLRAFDGEAPAERFFTEAPSRPTSDAVTLVLDLPLTEERGFVAIAERLRGEEARAVMADCFIQDWELHHERAASASLLLKMSTRLRDMGTYDVYVPKVELVYEGVEVEGFAPCVAGALTAVLEEGMRLGRSAAWQVPLQLSAGLK